MKYPHRLRGREKVYWSQGHMFVEEEDYQELRVYGVIHDALVSLEN